MLIYFIIQFIVNVMFAIIWNKKDWPNVGIKLVFIVLSLFTFLGILHFAGVPNIF